jgi:hypothetical protein
MFDQEIEINLAIAAARRQHLYQEAETERLCQKIKGNKPGLVQQFNSVLIEIGQSIRPKAQPRARRRHRSGSKLQRSSGQ